MQKLLSVNVSLPKKIEYEGKVIETGIFKEAITGKVKVNKLNITGDGQADLIGHGGEMRAVYVYSYDNYKSWSSELNRDDFEMGQFGENLTVEGLQDDQVHVGDQFRIGTVLFEVSQPRVPCYKLSIKMKEENFNRKILKSGRLGFYMRVLEEGEIEAGNDIQLVKKHPTGLTIDKANSLLYFERDNFEALREALKIEALSPGWKDSFEKYLSKEK